jgi:putative SOS response-associated peptidase YedK
MPVILGAEERWKWLQHATGMMELKEMLKPYPQELMAAPERIDPKALYLLRE